MALTAYSTSTKDLAKTNLSACIAHAELLLKLLEPSEYKYNATLQSFHTPGIAADREDALIESTIGVLVTAATAVETAIVA